MGGGHFSFPDADAVPGSTGLALSRVMLWTKSGDIFRKTDPPCQKKLHIISSSNHVCVDKFL